MIIPNYAKNIIIHGLDIVDDVKSGLQIGPPYTFMNGLTTFS